MKILKHIPVLILGIIYMLSSAGIVVYQTFCACTGDQQVSLYVTPETCENEYHHKHACENDSDAEKESSTDDCGGCSDHTGNCGCNAPMVQFYKLDDRLINEKVRVDSIVSVDVPLPIVLPDDFHFTEDLIVSHKPYIDPPPLKPTSLDFLIHIHQLKLHCKA